VELDRKQEEAANELIRLQEATEAITLKKKLKSDAKKAVADAERLRLFEESEHERVRMEMEETEHDRVRMVELERSRHVL
jgi:hypothetical protein